MESELKSFFVDAELEHAGTTYRLPKSEADALVSRGSYWHLEGDPSSWLCVRTFQYLRSKFPALPQSAVLELEARAMAISAGEVRGAIEWSENYMRWHDGDPDYAVLDPEPE